jgi:hypothetical protein
MGTLKIERIGGLAGIGLAGSKIKSSGEAAISALSADDQASVEALFHGPAHQPGPAHESDGFRYRLTRVDDGKIVEVPESAVPSALKACVSDKLL